MKTAITGATLITQDHGRIISEGTLILEDNVVHSLGEASMIPLRGVDEVIDASGMTVLPGLINMHDHVARKRLRLNEPGMRYKDQSDRLMAKSTEYLALHTARNLYDHVCSGVTTVRDFGLPGVTALEAHQAVEEGVIPGPQLLTGGDPIAISGGHATNWGAQEVDGPVEITKAVRKAIHKGAHVLKFMASGGLGTYPDEDPGIPELTVEELAAGITTAHQFGRPAAAHAYSTESIKNTLQAGIDTVEHGAFMDEETATLMIETGAAHVPTVSGLVAIGFNLKVIGRHALGQQILDEVITPLQQSVRISAEHGVPLVTGTDTSGEIVEELELIAEAAGWSPEQVLGAATDVAADVLGIPAGRLRPGLRADVLVVDGDPLADLEALRRPQWVFARGRQFSGKPAPLGVRLRTLQGVDEAL
ncbi:metal-dependent hydrolase family protein [Nesterenkonia ebinurensis]|uniref:metal-dependent hydrolase family protein n=1 Tax=Nesterenkonia ebinurensis TaxID=2608252 RepID=UPI00123D7798|nr:amidohydrolase family protein [Nesterenkonia ebinurensis]